MKRTATDTGTRRLARGPRITLTCECGERRDLRYGERWRCEKCGRTWDTHKIPPEDYAAVLRVRRRFVLVPTAMLVAVIVTVVMFMLYGRIYAFVLLPFAVSMWGMYGRNLHRRRLHRALDRLAKWEITPD
jgi:Flp pilus assembly protein TadB